MHQARIQLPQENLGMRLHLVKLREPSLSVILVGQGLTTHGQLEREYLRVRVDTLLNSYTECVGGYKQIQY